jgi:beta-N-acetylhexosaminidase
MKIIKLLAIILALTGCNAEPQISSENIIIIDKPIDFGSQRIEGTKEYIRTHYGLSVKDITIKPKMIVLHWTAIPTLEKSFAFLKPQALGDRPDIKSGGNVNVSAHFLVDRDGTIYRLMPETYMARHIIGLNYSAIGIENVGGKNNNTDDLTSAQTKSNIALVKYLKTKYQNIEYLIGHHEYARMKNTQYWLEKDDSYFTQKSDPGDRFMKSVRDNVKDLHLLTPPAAKDCR